MYTNTSCTLYLKSNNYEPVVIPHAYLTHRKIYSVTKNNAKYSESAFVMINMADFEFNEGLDFLVEGTCEFIFTNPDDQKTMSEELKEFKAAYDVYTIMCADKKQFGNSYMRHIEISCK